MNKQALANDMVDAIWTLWTIKAYTEHGEFATVNEMLAVARQTADMVSHFLDKTPLADGLYALMQERITEAFTATGGAPIPTATFIQ